MMLCPVWNGRPVNHPERDKGRRQVKGGRTDIVTIDGKMANIACAFWCDPFELDFLRDVMAQSDVQLFTVTAVFAEPLPAGSRVCRQFAEPA